MQTQLVDDIQSGVSKVILYCGQDAILAQKVLETVRAGFHLPSLRVIPEGAVRTTLQTLLCNIAGLDSSEVLPDGNRVASSVPAKPKLNLITRLLHRIKGMPIEEKRTLIVQEPDAPLVINNVTLVAKKLLTEKINELVKANRKGDHSGISLEGTEDHQNLRSYVSSARFSDLYDRSTQSAFEFRARATIPALIISSLSSMATYFLAESFWEPKVVGFFAVAFATCAYVLSDLVVFYWNDLRYKNLGKSGSIFNERVSVLDHILTGIMYLQTILSMHVSPYLALSKIPVPGLNAVAFVGACISPLGSNSSILERSFYGPLKAHIHMLQYRRNPNDHKNLRKRIDNVLMLTKAKDIFRRNEQ